MPDSLGTAPTGPRTAATLARRVPCWARAALGRRGEEERALHELADLLREPRGVAEVRRALVRLACQAFGARKAELVSETDPRRPTLLARWPEADPLRPSARLGLGLDSTLSRDAPPLPPRESPTATPAGAGPSLRLPIRSGGVDRGVFVVVAGGRRGFSARSARRLATLAALAAAAEGWAFADESATAGSARDAATGLPGPEFLATYLEKTLAQARRRHEPLALLAIAPERLSAVRETHGARLADAALQRVARAVVATLRDGDLVARVSADRLVAVLPMAEVPDALAVAEAVRRAIGEAGIAGAGPNPLTAAIGVAGFPDDADGAEALLNAATGAMGRARSMGRNRVAKAARTDAPPATVER